MNTAAKLNNQDTNDTIQEIDVSSDRYIYTIIE